MSKVLLIDIGGTNLRYAYSDGDFSFLKETNKIQLSCIKGFDEILTTLTKNIEHYPSAYSIYLGSNTLHKLKHGCFFSWWQLLNLFIWGTCSKFLSSIQLMMRFAS